MKIKTEFKLLLQKTRRTFVFITQTSQLKDKDLMLLALNKFIDSFEASVSHHGIVHTLSYFKEVRLCTTRYLSGTPIKTSELKHFIGLAKNGLPKILGDLYPYVLQASNPEKLRLVLTVLSIGRQFELTVPKVVDISSITRPPGFDPENIEDLLDDFEDFVKRKMKTLKVQLPLKYNFKEFHLTLSSGPHGPAMVSALWEANSMPQKLVSTLSRLPGDLGQRLHYLRDNKRFHPEWEKNLSFRNYGDKPFRYGRLSYLPDSEGKIRVIGVLNYWTQTALRPIHDEMMSLLRVFDWDCTHNQSRVTEVLKVKHTNNYHSVDLKDATDRFPILLQERVIRVLFGKELCKLWLELITPDMFDPKSGTNIKYSVGQPMGAYSSWPTFAVTHGLLLSYVAELMDEPENFKILGDDVVIYNDTVATKYKKILKVLDIPISESKTMDSTSTFEFAKRWFYQGSEISPFPLGAAHESVHSYSMLSETFRVASEKGWFKCSGTGPAVARAFWKAHKFPDRFLDKACVQFRMFTLFPRKVNLDVEETHRQWVLFMRACGGYVSCVSWRSHSQQTLMPYIREAFLKSIGEGLVSIAHKSDEIWSLNYHSGLDSTANLTVALQDLLIWANPILSIISKEKEAIAIQAKAVDETIKVVDLDNLTRVIEDLRIFKVLDTDSFRKERSYKRLVKAQAKMVENCARVIVKNSESLS